MSAGKQLLLTKHARDAFNERELDIEWINGPFTRRTGLLRPRRASSSMTPTVHYQAEDNAAYIRLSSDKILESAEVAPNVIFDYDAEGRIVGIELLDARSQLSAELLRPAA